MQHWKRLSRKKILDHPRVQMWEDTVELPDGHVTDYVHLGESAGAVIIVAVNDKGEVLVQREYSYPVDEWLYQFPGGAMNKGETPEHAAARELAEEANLAAGKLTQIGWYHIDNRRVLGKFYVFVAEGLSPCTDHTADPEEFFEDHWFTTPEIERMIRDGEFLNHAALAAWTFFKLNYKPKAWATSGRSVC